MDSKMRHGFTYESEEAYVRKMIEVYAAMLPMNDNKWLTPRETDLFVQYVLLHKEGYNLVDKESVALLHERANFKPDSKGLSIYKGKLIKKEWIYPTRDGIELPSVFKYIYRNGGSSDVEVSISVKYTSNEND